MRLAGELAVLNPILELMLAGDDQAFSQVALLIDARRTAAGLDLMWPPEEPDKFDRVANQRRIMAERRARSGRAAKIENASRSERNRLYGNARLEFERNVLNKWGRQLEASLNAARQRNGGTLSRETTQRIRAAFWADIDDQMSADEERLRREGKL